MNKDELKSERKILRKFKDDYAVKMEITDVNDWYSYVQWCKSNGFDESEIGYDDLIIDYYQFRLENSKQ